MVPVKIIIEQLSKGALPDFSDLYGTNPAILSLQREEYLKLAKSFVSFHGDGGAMLFSSPGRTEVGGNHTDHNNGRVLAGAVNLDNIAIAAPNHSNLIRIKSEGFSDLNVDTSNLDPVQSEMFTSAGLVRGICAGFKNLGYQVGGFDACIKGRVPKGSGLSSSASFEVLIGSIINELFNDAKLSPVENAKIGQFAENHFFGKPCGLMDQMACAVGGLITIDFKNPANPEVRKVNFNFATTGFHLVITDTGGNHANLNDEYAALPGEMKKVASLLGKENQRELSMPEIVKAIPALREQAGDRAILRAFHFQRENQRVANQVNALENDKISSFLKMVIDSGYSSFMYNQNIYPANNVSEQGVSVGLALSEMVLEGEGAWRVHGGGFAGTIQAFVPAGLLNDYVAVLENVFGKGACQILSIRSRGACRVNI